jgi:hypothetical protein
VTFIDTNFGNDDGLLAKVAMPKGCDKTHFTINKSFFGYSTVSSGLIHVFNETLENSFPHATQQAKIRNNAASSCAVRGSRSDGLLTARQLAERVCAYFGYSYEPHLIIPEKVA